MESYRKTGALERDDVYTAQSRAPARVVYLSVSYVFGIRRRNFFRLFGACKSDFRSEGNVYRTQKFVWGKKRKKRKTIIAVKYVYAGGNGENAGARDSFRRYSFFFAENSENCRGVPSSRQR